MSRIAFVDYENAPKDTQIAYDAQLKKAGGYVTNMKKTLLRSLPSYHALMQWYVLRDVISPFIGERGVAIFSHAISTENECLVCSMFFRKAFADLGIDLKTLVFSEQEQLLEDFGRRLVSDPNNIDDALFTRLQAVFSEEEIVSLTSFGAIMIATNLINTALKVPLDAHLIPFNV